MQIKIVVNGKTWVKRDLPVDDQTNVEVVVGDFVRQDLNYHIEEAQRIHKESKKHVRR